MNTFDIIVIGAGSGGLNVASFMNSVGLTVLLIDKSDKHIGGDCLNTGCIPSKAFIHVARILKDAKSASLFGVTTLGTVDLEKVMAYVHGAQDIIREHESAAYFRGKGMTVVFGEASFVAPDAVSVGDKIYRAKKILIATGSRPRSLTIPGVDEVAKSGMLFTNENIFSLTKLPKKLLVVGAGPIGIELGQAFRHLGTDVTIVSNDARILPREDARVAAILMEQLKEEGVVFHGGVNTVRFEKGSVLIIEDATTHAETTLHFDAVLVSIGRVLNTESLALEKAGVECDEKGKIIVDAYLRTTNTNILVCGDVAGGHQFTHAAELHAGVIIRNMFTPFFKKKLSTDALSWVTYTTPEIATYGLGEADLTKRGIAYDILESSFADDDRAITDDAQYGYTKMLIEKKSKRILGGTMIAPHAGELVQELILAVQNNFSTNALFNKIYPYPTATRINKRLVSNHERNRLTSRTKALLRFLYSRM